MPVPAPTALKKEEVQDIQDGFAPADISPPLPPVADDDVELGAETLPGQEDVEMGMDAPASDVVVDEENRPKFGPAQDTTTAVRNQNREVRIPPHRMTPLKQSWPRIYPPLTEHLKLQMRMNLKRKAIEMRTSKHTTDPEALQRGADFINAFVCGFDVDDAIALLRLDDLYIESFQVKDVKMLSGDHLARAIGRIAGKDGKTKFAIENSTRTRIVLADSKIHILGGHKNVQLARRSVCNLILGQQPGKVYNNLRNISSRMKERF